LHFFENFKNVKTRYDYNLTRINRVPSSFVAVEHGANRVEVLKM